MCARVDRLDEAARRRPAGRAPASGGAWSGSGAGKGSSIETFTASIAPALTSPRMHGVGDVRRERELADQPLPVGDALERLLALRGEPVGDEAGQAIFGDGPARRRARLPRRCVMRSTAAIGAR